MKSILIISNAFAPDLDGGVFRPLKFTKYLPKSGWNPVILKSKVRMQKKSPSDENLCSDFPPDLKIYETYSLEKIFNMFQRALNAKNDVSIPDVHVGWLPFAFAAGKKIINKEKIDMLLTTGPPHSTHLVGYCLKKLYGIPWVADFQDPWTLNFLKIQYSVGYQRIVDSILEKMIVETADRVVTVTEPIKNDLVELYNWLPKDKFINIPNGYDIDDFKGLEPEKSSKFTITYTGSFYGELSPDIFFQCLEELLSEKPEMKNSIKIIIAGLAHEELLNNKIENYHLKDVVEYKGVVPYQESLRLMVNSDVLLLILPSDKNNDRIKNVYTQKIFNYLIAKKTILAIVPKGIASDLIASTNSGIAVDPTNVEGIKKIIYNLYQQYFNGTLNEMKERGDIEEFNREKQTLKLAQIFNEILSDK